MCVVFFVNKILNSVQTVWLFIYLPKYFKLFYSTTCGGLVKQLTLIDAGPGYYLDGWLLADG